MTACGEVGLLASPPRSPVAHRSAQGRGTRHLASRPPSLGGTAGPPPPGPPGGGGRGRGRGGGGGGDGSGQGGEPTPGGPSGPSRRTVVLLVALAALFVAQLFISGVAPSSQRTGP